MEEIKKKLEENVGRVLTPNNMVALMMLINANMKLTHINQNDKMKQLIKNAG